MSITAAKLQAEIGADTKGFDKGMAHANGVVQKAPGLWSHALSTGLGVGLERATTAIIKGAFGFIQGGLDSLTQQGVVVAQTNAVIKSTGAAAHVTAAQIRDLSTAMEAKTTVDDKVVQADANLLLTFTNVKNAAGAGNDIFSQTVSVFEDMKTAMPSSSMVQLGKALNDPAKGMTALTRVGVTFSEQQKKQITANASLSKEETKRYAALGKSSKAEAERYKAGILTNKQLDSQKIILAELNKEFGGSGAAFAATDAGKALKFQDAIEGVQQALTGALLPALTRIRGALTTVFRDPATLAAVTSVGDAIAGIFSEGNIRTAASVMTTAAHAISTAIGLFSSLPPEIQALAVGAFAVNKLTGGLVTTLVKGVANIGLNLIGGATTGAEIGGAMTAAGAVAGAEIAGAMTTAGAGAAAEIGAASAVSGATGSAGAAAGILGMLKNGLSVGIAAASIAALAYEIGQFINTVGTAQTDLTSAVTNTRTQDFTATVANLQATTDNLKNMSMPDRLIALTFGGGQITRDYIEGAKRLTSATLNSADAAKALPAVQAALERAQYEHLAAAIDPLKQAEQKLQAEIAANTTAISTWTPLPSKLADVPQYAGALAGKPTAEAAQQVARMGERMDKLGPTFAGILERASSHQKEPTWSAVQSTYLRNLARRADMAAAAAATYRAGERDDLGQIAAAARDTAAAIRAKEFTVQQLATNTSGGTGGNVGGDQYPKAVPVILSPRAVPNANRGNDLYGPTSVRNGRAVPTPA